MKAEHLLQTGQLQPLFGSGYPLAVILAAVFIKIFQLTGNADAVWAVNMVSVIFGSLTVGVFYELTRRLYGPLAAVFGTLLFMVTPIFLGLAVYGKNHVPSLYFLLQGMVFLHRGLQEEKRTSLYLAGLSLGAMGAYRLQDLILMIIPLVFFLGSITPGKGGSLIVQYRRPLLMMVSLVMGVIAVFHLPYFLTTDQASYHGQFARFWNAGVKENYFGLVSPQLTVVMIYLLQTMSEVGLILAICGFFLGGRRRAQTFFVLSWVVVPLLFYGNLKTATTPRFFLLILPAFFMAQGFALAELAGKGKAFRCVSVLIFGLIIFLTFGFIYPKVKIRHEHAYLPEYCRWLEQKTEPTAVIIATDEIVFIRYYTRRATLARPKGLGHLDSRALDDFFFQMGKLFEKGIPVYITAPGMGSYDNYREFSTRLREKHNLISCGSHVYEDWHKGELFSQVYRFSLYKIEQKGR